MARSRRDFLKQTGCAIASAVALPQGAIAVNTSPKKVRLKMPSRIPSITTTSDSLTSPSQSQTIAPRLGSIDREIRLQLAC